MTCIAIQTSSIHSPKALIYMIFRASTFIASTSDNITGVLHVMNTALDYTNQIDGDRQIENYDIIFLLLEGT